jgi:DNA-directed RNA polymerase sigma subunit (sigma70/sigma32)
VNETEKDNKQTPSNKLDRVLHGLDPNFAIGTLPPRHQLIMEKRFGLLDGRPLNQKDLAAELGVKPQRISQIELRSLGRLAALRELYRPEKVFFKEETSIDGVYDWSPRPHRYLHKTWEDKDEDLDRR